MDTKLEAAKQKIEQTETTISKIESLIQSESQRATAADTEAGTMRIELAEAESELALARIDGLAAKEQAARAKELTSLRATMDSKLDESRSSVLAVEGLKKRLEQAKTDLEQYYIEYHKTAERVVLAEAEQVGAEYLKAAMEFRELHAKLIALDSLQRAALRHQGLGAKPGFAHFNRTQDTEIPSFALTCFDGFKAPYTSPSEHADLMIRFREALGIKTFDRKAPRQESNAGNEFPGSGSSFSVVSTRTQMVG